MNEIGGWIDKTLFKYFEYMWEAIFSKKVPIEILNFAQVQPP